MRPNAIEGEHLNFDHARRVKMTLIMEEPSDPVFLDSSVSIRLKIGRGKRARITRLSPHTARRLACALLLEAEKRETMDCPYKTRKLVSTVDKAVAAVARFHSSDEKLRRQMKDRSFSKWLHKKQTK
jgi:hypothetical protein